MKEIIINSDTYGVLKSQVDDEDYERVKDLNWNISYSKGNLYVTARQFYPNDKKRKVKLHQVVMMPYDDVNFVVDHRDNDALNNQKSNLRLATHKQNTHNRRPLKNKFSQFKGVVKGHKCFAISITVDGNYTYIKGFQYEIEAAFKYNELARQHHGEFAYQNPVTAIKYADGTMYTHEVKTPCSTPIRDKDFIVDQVRTFIHNRA